jgi:hypothetical protein
MSYLFEIFIISRYWQDTSRFESIDFEADFNEYHKGCRKGIVLIYLAFPLFNYKCSVGSIIIGGFLTLTRGVNHPNKQTAINNAATSPTR